MHTTTEDLANHTPTVLKQLIEATEQRNKKMYTHVAKVVLEGEEEQTFMEDEDEVEGGKAEDELTKALQDKYDALKVCILTVFITRQFLSFK